VVGLIEQGAGLTPRTLLITPVCKLVLHNGKGVRSNLRIAQQLNRITGGFDYVF